MTFRAHRQHGSALIGVLWCVALLSILAVSLLHTTQIDLKIAKNYSDRIQARYLALAGVEKAKALLLQDARTRSRSGKSHSTTLYDAPTQFKDIKFGRGEYRLLRRDESGTVANGVSDEDGRLNINVATQEELMKIRGMTPDVAAAIMDWRDRDNTVSPGGAEAEYYASLRPPYSPRNKDFPSIRELLMVRGISRSMLYGEGPTEDFEERGWSALFTTKSIGSNKNNAGNDRVNVQTADEAALTGVRGISSDIAKAIIAHRDRNRFENLADLLDVARANPNNQNRPGRAGRPPIPAPGGDAKVIDDRLFKDIADEVTIAENQEFPGLVNINSAPVDVLLCLPGLDRPIAEAIVARRKSNGFYENIAYLLDVPGVTKDIFKRVSPRVTARSETYRILAEGRIIESGVRARTEVTIRVTPSDVSTISWREDGL